MTNRYYELNNYKMAFDAESLIYYFGSGCCLTSSIEEFEQDEKCNNLIVMEHNAVTCERTEYKDNIRYLYDTGRKSINEKPNRNALM